MVKAVRLLGDGEQPYVRLVAILTDSDVEPVALDMRGSLAVDLAKQIIALADAGKIK